MSEFEFVDAVRANTNLLIGYAGASGSGKTYSALETAYGLAGPDGKVALLDTEAGRAKHYADVFRFKHGDLRPPFTPQRFLEAIRAAEKAKFDVLIIDSASDEYEGEGGLQEMHDNAVVRLAKKKSIEDLEGWEYDKYNAPAWSGPKTIHKRVLMNPLRQLRMHLIFCLRAEDKIEFGKEKYIDKRGEEREKTSIKQRGWIPICEKRFMYDMTVSCVFSPDAPGVPMVTESGLALNGKIQKQHLHAFPVGKQISRDTGRLLGEWARGAKVADVTASKDLSARLSAAREAIKSANSQAGLSKVWKATDKLRAELDPESLDSLTLEYEGRDAELKEGVSA
jgi:hypothetical protein